MESPESSKPTTETAPAQESPVFSYISNLSPIQPVTALGVTPGFPGLNSPPLFRSPRLNPSSQPTLFRRAQFPGLSATELSQQDADCKNSVTAVNRSEKLDIQLSTRLLNSAGIGSDSNCHMNYQIESLPECSDQFLSDSMNMDSAGPNVSSDAAFEKYECIDQSLDAIAGPKESAVRPDKKHNTGINDEIAVDPPPITTETEDVSKEDMSAEVSVLETYIKQGDGVSVDQCFKTEPELPVSYTLTNQEKGDSMTENVKNGQVGPFNQPSKFLSGTMQIDDENENFVEATGSVFTKPVLTEEQNNSEAFLLRGIRRRCLQFDDAQRKEISYCPAQNSSDSEVPETQSLEIPQFSVDRKQGDTIQPVSYTINNLNSTIMIPKPSGIGLHLNSIVNAALAGSGGIFDMKPAQRGNFSIHGKKSVPMSNSHLSNNTKSSSILSAEENVSASIDDKMHESHSSEATNSATSLSTYVVKPLNNSVILNPVEATPDNKRKCNTENDGGSDELNKSISIKKRKKSLDSGDGDGDGCKRCNCKKSRCLKLYCDCFAAGIYCAETCTCQGCFNRPEYEDTVLETRQQIESRNPLAFAPKVVQHVIELPLSNYGEDQTHFTPASARHKRGCNCKKSMCLKKYCECYQANVGCSEGCRCEGCQNVFGQKGECGRIKDVLCEKYSSERTDASSVENFEMLASGNGLYDIGLQNPHNLTPVTPAFEFSNHRKDASNLWFPSGRYLQSPGSGSPFIAPYAMSPGPPTNSDGNDRNSETAKEILDLVSFDHEIDHGGGETANKFSAVYDQPGKLGSLSSMSNPQEWASFSKAQSLSGSRQYSSLNSFHWRGSPNTPMAQFSGTKHLQFGEIDSVLSSIMQDDTPAILKDTPTPLNAVKVSSPNKKRVSPPHGQPEELRSSSSAGLRTGRKFILKAVSSFPPLTPCTDSKTAVQPTNDHQNLRDNDCSKP